MGILHHSWRLEQIHFELLIQNSFTCIEWDFSHSTLLFLTTYFIFFILFILFYILSLCIYLLALYFRLEGV